MVEKAGKRARIDEKTVKQAVKKTKPAEGETKKKVTFKFFEPDARSVYVAGSFNDWDPSATPLKKGSDGTWKGTKTLSPGSYEYRFVVDGDWRDDPTCTDRRTNEFGGENCVVKI